MKNIIDLTGDKYGKLTVIGMSEKRVSNRICWECLCECGNTSIITGNNLRRGTSRSCGCEHKKQLANRNRSHNMAKTRIHRIWRNIKTRCDNKNTPTYKNYGGRGITYCDKWKTFEGFYEDMGSTYKDGLSIDRIDNNGNYCKDNCKWSTQMEQSNNTRRNRFIEYNGEIKTMAQWSRFLKMKYGVLSSRISNGWSIEDAFNRPIKGEQL